MRVIVESDLTVELIDGYNWVRDAKCLNEEGRCFSFDKSGLMVGKCRQFARLLTGVKLCGKESE
jgi:hypothetical protein